MTLPATGPLSASQINTELGRASGAAISLGASAVRSLAGVASGAIGFVNLRGKSSIPGLSVSASNVSANDAGFASSGAVGPTGNAATTPSGGVGPYTYSWARVSGSTVPGASSLTAQNPTWSAASVTGIQTAIWRVTVTDSLGATATAEISVTLTWIDLS